MIRIAPALLHGFRGFVGTEAPARVSYGQGFTSWRRGRSGSSARVLECQEDPLEDPCGAAAGFRLVKEES